MCDKELIEQSLYLIRDVCFHYNRDFKCYRYGGDSTDCPLSNLCDEIMGLGFPCNWDLEDL